MSFLLPHNFSYVGKPRLTRLNFPDAALISFHQPGFLTATVGAFLSIFHGFVVLLTTVTAGHCRQRLNNQFRLLQKGNPLPVVVPAVGDVVMDDTADFSNLQGHTTDFRYLVFLRHLLQCSGNVYHNS